MGNIWSARAVSLVVLACGLRAATKKKVNFSRKKVHPEKIVATPVAKH